jgi:hypothetical protein
MSLLVQLLVTHHRAEAQQNNFPYSATLTSGIGPPSDANCKIGSIYTDVVAKLNYTCLSATYPQWQSTNTPGGPFLPLAGGTTTGPVISPGIYDATSLMFKASQQTGTNVGQKISNAFAAAYSASSAAIIDACDLTDGGTVNITSDPFASIRTAYTDFQGVLILCGAHMVFDNNLLPLVIPGGITIEGQSSHPLPAPNYPANRGTTIQPKNYYKGPVVAMGGINILANNFNPMGVRLKNMAISCLPPGGVYSTSTVNITNWATVGSSYPYVGTFTYSGAPNQVAQWDIISLSGFATTTTFNGQVGRALVVTSVTGNTFTAFVDLPASSATEAGVGTLGMGTTGLVNLGAQEASYLDTVGMNGCQTDVGWDVDPSNGTFPSSGFDSTGVYRGLFTLPADPNATCIKFGGTAEGQLISFPANVNGFVDTTCQGTLTGGVSTGTCISVEGVNTTFSGIRCAYVDTIVRAGMIKSTNTLTFINVDDVFSNPSYPWNTLFYFGPKTGYGINIFGGSGLGTASGSAVTLYDFNYPTGPCTLLASSEASIGLYSRGIGGGGNGIALSTSRTGCTTVNLIANVATTTASNVWTATNDYASIVHTLPTATTPATNLASNIIAHGAWCGSCGSPATFYDNDFLGIGAGATPAITKTFDPPPSPPGSTIYKIGGALRSWTEAQIGNSTNQTLTRFWGGITQYGADQTHNFNFQQPTLAATVSTYLGQGLSNPLGTPTFTPGTNVTSCACAASYTCTNTTGELTIVTNGSFTTGLMCTVNFSATLGSLPSTVQVEQSGGATRYGLSHSLANATNFTISAAVTAATATVTVDYKVNP